jgi:hypothetical protein
MADLRPAPERLFHRDGTLAYATGEGVPAAEVRLLLTEAQLHAQQHPPQGPRGSRPHPLETRS